MVGSHLSVSRIPGATFFDEDLLASVERDKPDLVLLRAAGHGAVSVAEIAACPVPVVGLYHDWVAWGSERAEAVARSVDWLVTEKSACRYLRAAGYDNVSSYLLMSRDGVERVGLTETESKRDPAYRVCFLGSFYLGGTDNPLRRASDDVRGRHHETMMARLGFRERSPYVARLAQTPGSFVAASTAHLSLGAGDNPSFRVVADCRLNVHVDGGRQHAANRCFESMTLGTPLLVEEGNELLDYVPEHLVIPYTLDTLDEVVARWNEDPRGCREIGRMGRNYAMGRFTNHRLAEGLEAHLKMRWAAIQERFAARRIDAADQRAPVHWEGRRLYHRATITPHLEANASTPSGEAELGCYAFEAAQVLGEAGALDRALNHLKIASVVDPGNATYRWNLAVVRHAMGDHAGTRREVETLLRVVDGPFTWSGSRLELTQGGWTSSHVEHALALAKIDGDHRALEARAFRYRAGMVLGTRSVGIQWPELPDEHLREGNLARARALDPLLEPTPEIRAGIEDLRLAEPRAVAV